MYLEKHKRRDKKTTASRALKTCRPFPCDVWGKSKEASPLVRCARGYSSLSLSLSLSHTHAVVVVVTVVVIVVHAKLESARPISAFFREYSCESGGGRNVTVRVDFASKAYHNDDQFARGVVAVVVQREHFNRAKSFVLFSGAFYVCFVLWENDESTRHQRWRW